MSSRFGRRSALSALLVALLLVQSAGAAVPAPQSSAPQSTAAPADSASFRPAGGVDVLAQTGANGTAGDDSASAGDSPDADDSPAAADSAEPTVRHEDPDRSSGEGDLADVQRWLSGRMGEVIVDCTERVRVGSSYVCDRLDEEYPKWASQYVDVAGRTESESDDNASRVVDDTRENQREFAESVREFREVRDDYRDARARGDERRARELARRVLDRARRVEDSGERLSDNYGIIAANTTANLTNATEAVTEVRTNTSAEATEIRRFEFITTELAANATVETASFASPLSVAGRLATENGSAVANRQIRLRVGDGRAAVETDENGEFVFDYRPTTERVGDRALAVTYVPRNDSLYARSNDTVSVVVESTESTVTVASDSAAAAHGDDVRVTGRVEAADRAVADVPVAVTLGGVALGRARTNESGAYALDATVPSSVDAGERSLVARVALTDRAIESANATAALRIESTETSLSLAGTRTGERTGRVSGRLATDAGALADRPVTISVDGETIASARTGANGRFAFDVDLPGSVTADEAATVVARYDPSGGNLEPARAAVELGPARGAGGVGGDDPGDRDLLSSLLAWLLSGDKIGLGFGLSEASPATVLALLAGGVLALAAAYLGRDRLPGFGWALGDEDGSASGGSDANDGAADADERSVEEAVSDAVEPATPSLDAARERLSAGDADTAVVIAYDAACRHLSERLGRDPSMTHWELLVEYGKRLSGDRTGDLRRLTEAYERAAFAPRPNDADTAGDALSAASRLLDGSDGGSPSDGGASSDD